jgi:hypothetical protein
VELGWLKSVIEAYGEPRLNVPAGTKIRTDEGTCLRRSWVWFVGKPLANHHISIDQYSRWGDTKGKDFNDWTSSSYWIIRVGSHSSDIDEVELRTRIEPDSPTMYRLIDLTGFLNTPKEA